MARSKFYYHIKRMKLKEKYVLEKKEIKDIFHEHKGRYGYRRITAEMRNRNYVINHKTVQRLMGEMGLKCRIRKVRYRSYRGEIGKVAPNVIDRNFVATSPNRKWATDVTQKILVHPSCICHQFLICIMGKLSLIISLIVLIWSRCTICLTRLLKSSIILMA